MSASVYEKVSNLCNLCAGPESDKCTTNMEKNKYVGYHGAFKCMADGKGDVAFVKYTTTKEVTDGGKYGKPGDYQYLCPDGGRKGNVFKYGSPIYSACDTNLFPFWCAFELLF